VPSWPRILGADLFFALARGRTGSLPFGYDGYDGAALGLSREWLV
jgi:hypothetical protein